VTRSDRPYDDNFLPAIGGLLAVVASLISGVAIARAHRLVGWSRWVVLGYAIYVLAALFVPLAFGVGPNAATETVWGVSWVAIGVTLTGSHPGPGQ
jgi:hypothetical protein